MTEEAETNGLLPRVGLLGELEVELRLVKYGWHPVRLDTRQMASNADLLAINRLKRVAIQVKATSGTGHAHASDIFLGYAGKHLSAGTALFNSKDTPLLADVVVGVNYVQGKSRFVVLPVGLAEKLGRQAARYWNDVPKRNGRPRSGNFPLYLKFAKESKVHVEHHSSMRKTTLAYEDKWDVLLEPIEKLHDPSAWRLL
jgi:hypothetical protein